MPEIFISYRHGPTDAWAAVSIAERIRQHFPLFCDAYRGSLDLGTAFPPAIKRALDECRVLFAIMGPDWNSQESLRRLHRDDDWVRTELRTALGRPTMRVVPLLIAPANLPDASSLPDDVATIVTREALRLSPDRIEIDCDELVRRLEHWLAGRDTTPDHYRKLPPDLPYLCDRKEQEETFLEITREINSPQKLATCVVHGHKWESHDELLERFRNEGVLDDVFGRSDEGITIYAVQLNRGKLRAGAFPDALKSAVKADVLRKRTASDDDLRQWFSTLLQSVVIVVQFTWSDYQELGNEFVKHLVSAWLGLLRVDASATSIRLPHAVLLWINFTYEDDNGELSPGLLLNPLPKLSSVEERHIREWLRLSRVAPYVASKRQALLNLPSDSTYYHAPGHLHMMRFAQGVATILISS